MRPPAAAVEASVWRAFLFEASLSRCPSSCSTWTLRRSTATFRATMPASRAATTTIHRTPPATSGRARARGLLRGRADRLARDQPERRLTAAHAHREVWRADAPPRLCGEEALDDPVLEGVEADDGDPAPRPEHPDGGGQRPLERVELVVDSNSQSLEDTLRGMAVPETAGSGNGSFDRLDQVGGALEGTLCAAANDRLCDLTPEALLPIAAEDQGELALVPLVHHVLSGDRPRGIHTHVERRIDRVREPALGPVDLHARDTEVKEDRVGFDVVVCELGEDDPEVAPEEAPLDPGLPLEVLEVRLDGRVAVDGDEAALALQIGGEQPCMPARAERCVDDGLARPHGEELAHLVREDGNVVSPASLQGARQQAQHSLRPLSAACARPRDPRSRRDRGRRRRRRRGPGRRAR